MRFLVPILLTLALTGCGELMFVEPLALENETTFDPALVGTWFDHDNVVISVTAETPPRYDITASFVESGKSVKLEGRLVRLGEQRILDVYDPEPGLFNVGCHIWVYVQKKDSGMEIAYLDSQWLQDALRKRGLPSFTVDRHPVTTATQAQLREFAGQFAFRPEARAGSLVWTEFKKKQ